MDDWKSAFQSFVLRDQQNIDYMAQTSTQAKNNDVGMVNEESGSGILVRDDGSIELASDYGLAVKFEPKYKSLCVFAPNLHIFSSNIQKHETLTNAQYINGEYKKVLEIVQGK